MLTLGFRQVGSWDNNVYWYSIEFGRVMATLDAHDDAVSQVALFGDRLITASWDSTVKVWDYAAAASELSSAVCKRRTDDCVLVELDGVDSEIKCMDVHTDRELLVVGGSHEGRVVIWTLKSGYDVIQSLNVHDEAVSDVAFSPDGQRIVSCGNDRYVLIFGVVVRALTGTTMQHTQSDKCGSWKRNFVFRYGC